MHNVLPEPPKNKVLNFKMSTEEWQRLERLRLARSNKAKRVVTRSQLMRDIIKEAKP